MIELLYVLASLNGSVEAPNYTNVCYRDWSKKSLEAKIELSMGCSTVNGTRVYYNRILEEIYNDK